MIPMKIKAPFKMLKISTLVPFAITITALLTQPAFAQAPAPHDLQLTETSSTSLSVTYDGSTTGITIDNTSSNRWTVTFPTTIDFGVYSITGHTPPQDATLTWLEPENSPPTTQFTPQNLINVTVGSHQLTIASDSSSALRLFFNGESSAVLDTSIGTDQTNQAAIAATFTDNAATAEATVPDTGATLGLLLVSLIALLGARRRIAAPTS